jgi:hypothetical protein
MLVAISMVDAAPARGDVHVRMQVSPGECNGHLGGHTEFINGRLVNWWAALVREVASRMAECFHNFSVLAWLLLNGIFNLFGLCNFKWLRVAETAHPTTIARLIGRSVFGGMVWINFLRGEISTAHSSKLVCAIRQDNFCHCVMAGSMWLAASGCRPARWSLLFLIMRCTPTIHELIVLTLPPRHRCPLDRPPASRLLLPRSGLERSDFVPWHLWDMPTDTENVRLSGKTGSDRPMVRTTRLASAMTALGQF